jgi:hypothetical protein
MEFERRLNVLLAQREACHRLVSTLPRGTPRAIVIAAKRVCNDIETELRALARRFAGQGASPS